MLLAIHHFPPRYSAGAELYTFRLARWLLAHGHEAEVVCVETLNADRPAGVEAERDSYEGVPVWRLHLGLRGAPANWTYANPMVAKWIAGHMQTNRPDLLHLHSGYLIGVGTLEEARHLGVPSVVTLHDYWFLCPRFTLLRGDGHVCAEIPADPAGCAWCLNLDRRRYRLPEQISQGAAGWLWITLAGSAGREAQAARRTYLRETLARVDLVIAPSRFLAGMFANHLPYSKLRMLRCGLDTDLLAAVPPPSLSDTLRLGYLGQIAPHKGVHVLVQAVRQLPSDGRPIQLRVFGDLERNPDYTRQLRTLIDADPRITLAGPYNRTQLPAVLGDLDLTVVPSIWYENSPLAIMEAHAAGRPVITSRLGGMAELVRDGVDGLHFQPGDADDLARQIQRLRDDPGLLERLRAGVRPPPSIDDEMAELMQAYRLVIEQRRVTRPVEVG
ncbi:MAG: glycosyltransferase family 4 protein [Oscillochloridaceae bacterium]|nr:glycosyltransferase family 4 protein [Chloroflexaceae bacterium]MDW8389827.1 glycosyltransferase family 4 protein [Oscillochloridaceae bacterium]